MFVFIGDRFCDVGDFLYFNREFIVDELILILDVDFIYNFGFI